MSLKYLDEQIEAVRARAKSRQDAFNRETKDIERNPDLTAEGKKNQIAALRESTKAGMTSLRAEESKLAADKRAELERTVFGTVGTDPTSVITHRDAQDRAEKIADGDEAERVVKRALTTGDKSLALAVAQVSFTKGYDKAYSAFAEANPTVADAAKDLVQLSRYQSEGGFQRALAYLV